MCDGAEPAAPAVSLDLRFFRREGCRPLCVTAKGCHPSMSLLLVSIVMGNLL